MRGLFRLRRPHRPVRLPASVSQGRLIPGRRIVVLANPRAGTLGAPPGEIPDAVLEGASRFILPTRILPVLLLSPFSIESQR